MAVHEKQVPAGQHQQRLNLDSEAAKRRDDVSKASALLGEREREILVTHRAEWSKEPVRKSSNPWNLLRSTQFLRCEALLSFAERMWSDNEMFFPSLRILEIELDRPAVKLELNRLAAELELDLYGAEIESSIASFLSTKVSFTSALLIYAT